MFNRAGLVPALAAGVAATALMVGTLAAAAVTPDPTTSSAGTRLFDDDEGRALFDGTVPLQPGELRTACLAVGSVAAAGGDTIAFSAQEVDGPLASDLTLALDMGTGGGAGSCDGFVGERVWVGTLAALAQLSVAGGVPLSWEPSLVPQRSFRISVTVARDVRQGQRANADLVWRLSRTDRPVPAGPGIEPFPPDESSPALTEASRGNPIGPDLTLGGSPVAAAVSLYLRRALAAAIDVLRSPQYLLAALLATLTFLLIQDRIDRRDPKLMQAARRRRDVERTFPDPFHPRTSQG